MGCLLAGALVSACSHHAASPTGAGRLIVDGHAEVASGRGAFRPVGRSTTLHAGDRIHVIDGGASVQLVPDGLLELRNETRLRMDSVPVLETGDLLVEPGRRLLTISTDQADAAVPAGAARITRTLGLSVKSYQGTAALEAGGRPVLAIRAPRQATVADRDLLPEKALPIAYDPNDGWDRRYLAKAEELRARFDDYTKAFPAQLGAGQGHTPGFYKLLFPRLDQQPGFDDAFRQVENGPEAANQALKSPSNYLLGAAIALKGTEGTVAGRWLAEFAFARDFADVADWGLIAYDQGVTGATGVADDVLAAEGRAPLLFTLPVAARALAIGLPAPASTTTVAPGPNGTVGPPPTTRPTAPPTTKPAPAAPLPHAPATGAAPVDKLVDPLVDPLIDTLNNLVRPPGR